VCGTWDRIKESWKTFVTSELCAEMQLRDSEGIGQDDENNEPRALDRRLSSMLLEARQLA
jgi:hypothetical protein